MDMTADELRTLVFKTVEDYGPKDALAMLLQYADENEDFRMAAAIHGHIITQAIREAKSSTVH